MRPVHAQINLAACHHNLARVRTLTNQRHVIAMIKANGYGHGLVRMAQAFQGADKLGVACLDEALIIREAHINTPILLMEGLFEAAELPVAQAHRLSIVVHQQEQLAMLQQAKLDREHPLPVWLKINTGMNRLGIPPEKLSVMLQALSDLDGVMLAGVMTHMACADLPEHPLNAAQLEHFQSLVQSLDYAKSMANSAAILKLPQSHYDWVRPGLMLYGVSPIQGEQGTDFDLKPVMQLCSSLIAIHALKQGDAVSYGATWQAPHETHVGVVAIGYGDGYVSSIPAGTPVLVNGRRVPIIGRVCMDMLMVDLGPQAKDNVGDDVLLWGDALPIEEIAAHTGVIPYDLLCNVGRRIGFKISDSRVA